MDESQVSNDRSLLDVKFSRRRALMAGAWSAPVVALVVAAPAVAASGFDPAVDLTATALGGAEGRYATGSNFTNGVVNPNQDFRRAFSIGNIGQTDFSGSLTVTFSFPRKWNEGTTNVDVDAFSNYGTVDLGGRDGGSIGSASGWGTTQAAAWTQNTGASAWTEVWCRMDDASATLNNVILPAGSTVWFALNATVPQQWIGDPGVYLPDGRVYWRSDIFITAKSDNGTVLGTYGPLPDPGGNWENGIWYWNGGGPYAYDGGEGLYPAYGTA